MARRELKKEKDLSPSLKVAMDGVLDLVVVLANRLGLDSSNSSKPPSSDPNRARRSRTTKGKRRKPGGQKGHKGSRLEPVENPTLIEELLIDRRTLPPGNWKSAGFDKRQVFDIEVSFSVTEYQAEILKNELGETFVAEFPAGVTEPAQYGVGVKATAVYLSQYQLIPQARVQDLFSTQYGLLISKASVNNFNILAARILREWDFKTWLHNELCTYSVSGDTKDVSGVTDCSYDVYIRGGKDNMDIRTFRSHDIINVSIGEFNQEHRNTLGTGKAFVLKDLQDCSFCKKKKVSFRFDKQDHLVEMNEIDLDANVFGGQSKFPDITCSGNIKVERRCN